MSDTSNSDRRSEKEIFFAALEQPTPDACAAFLDGACGKNPVMRQRIEKLLADHFEQDSFLTLPVVDGPPKVFTRLPIQEVSGTMIGRYKLLEQIGEGGFGEVWMAEQREPVKRRVALKLIKLGMDSRQIVARFEAERQALAMMDHANIAKIFDAGVTDTGRPYFVMELVRGIKITEYCDQNQLPTKDRLDLFIKVCQAIQHAHQKGVIHRDIKPSNILVTVNDGVPVPKVIDFGIAKATQGDLTDKTVFTQFQQFIGTPAYISPEQAEMSSLDIDTRADIYSLGVLLYELLVGQTPFDVKEMMKGGIDALRQIIREQEPLRPSTKLNTLPGDARTTAGKRRQTDTGKLVHQLQGDLDWIVMKCLEKDRIRRYDTANGLAADIQRHLANEPVGARPPSAAYRMQKAWQRNKLAFAAGGVVLSGLLIGLAAVSYSLVRERALKSESARADSIATFVTGMLNKAVPQLVRQGNSKGMRVLLQSADELVSTTLTNTPAAELTVRDTLQMFYGTRLRDPRGARKQTDRIESLLSLLPDDRLPPNRSRDDLRVDIARARFLGGAAIQGRAELEQLAEEFKQRGPAANVARAQALGMLGNVLLELNKPLEAEPPLAEAYRVGQSAGSSYARALILNGKLPRAEEVARATVNRINAHQSKPGKRRALDEFNAGLGNVDAYGMLTEVLCRLGRFDEGATLLAEQLRPGAARWTPPQIKTLKTLQWGVQAWSGQWREAAPGLIGLANDPESELYDWACGIAAAVATGDSDAHARLDRWGRAHYIGNAEAETAEILIWSIMMRPKQEDLSLTFPDLLHRIEEAKDFHWTAVQLPLLRSQLAYRKGEYEEALRLLDEWIQSRDERPLNAVFLNYFRLLPISEFWRAMMLARLGRAEGAAQSYGVGIQKMRAAIAAPWFVWCIYYPKAIQQEARDVLRSQGIDVPDVQSTP